MHVPLLIIDDEKRFSELLQRVIELEGYEVSLVATAKEGLSMLAKEDFSVVLCDVRLPDINGVDLIRQLKNIKPSTEIITMTAFGNIVDGVTAMKNGAFDYIIKGDDNDKIIPLVSKAAEKAGLQYRIEAIEKQVEKQYGFSTIVGVSQALKNAIDLAKKVSQTSATVLLQGETGTGKEVFAQAIHYNGNRRDKNFVALNCSAFGPDLLESELFGYRAGAFTGAVKDKKGLFEEANGGTLFLDEIGETGLNVQAKLLRVLENGEFIKVGDTKKTKVDVRIIAATNKNMEDETECGNFRRDLFYRLSTFTIMLPSLNERKEDIPLLAEHYIKKYSGKSSKQLREIDNNFINELINHNWKGNVRELKNVIERAIIIAGGEKLTSKLLPYDFLNATPYETMPFPLAEVEKRHIYQVLLHTGGNKTKTAQLLDIGLTTLYRKIEEYNLS